MQRVGRIALGRPLGRQRCNTDGLPVASILRYVAAPATSRFAKNRAFGGTARRRRHLFGEARRLAIEAALRMSTVTDPKYEIIRNGVVMSPAEYNEMILAQLPPVVAMTLRSFGWAQFRRMYDDFVEREQIVNPNRTL
jgi:hypothetical protein